MSSVLETKGKQAQLCYEDLKKRTGIEPRTEVRFVVDEKRRKEIERAVWTHNPFPGVLKPVLLSLRLKAVRRLFQDEKVLQTGPAAAILALDAAMTEDFRKMRDPDQHSDTVYCDVAFAGLQVIRLYMCAYEGNREFIRSRYESAIRVDNALNGSFYKYETKDHRYFSAHVYYESQKKIMMETLGIPKKPEAFVFRSLGKDRKLTADAIRKWNAKELEEAAFRNGACGCMLRTRREWENTEVGNAVTSMPLFRLEKAGEAPRKSFGTYRPERGPLSGIKVLDLTHIIAGPACTRLLAEAGADVLMIRRKDYLHQEQAMLELDGWAGKNSIQLDFHIPSQLAKAKQLIQEADVVISSYQSGSLDQFGLSIQEIHALNPGVVYGSLVCFSDTVWRERPGWAPCAEDITGLSIRNGSIERPVNLNGVPLDYIPGMILFAGIMKALMLQKKEGGSYTVTGSLTRGGCWLHECTDLWEKEGKDLHADRSLVREDIRAEAWDQVFHPVKGTSAGTVYFPSPATVTDRIGKDPRFARMVFHDGCSGF